MLIADLCMHALGILARIHAGLVIHVDQDKNVSWKTHCLFVPWLAFVLMDFTLETMASVFKVLPSNVYETWLNSKAFIFPTVTAVSQCTVHGDCRNTEQCHSGSCLDACRVEQCGTNAICTSRDHSISCACPPGYTGDARVACYPSESSNATFCALNAYADVAYFQSLPILWMSLLAVALMTSALIMLPASTKHVATLVLFLILVLPMLSARLFITHQSVLALQVTLVTLKLSANCHVSNPAFFLYRPY